ncbi:MAG: hypothetical protein ABIW34_03290, partial [Ginsengibacter sp.]
EKEYIRSMVEDLRTDTALFRADLKNREDGKKIYDTLIYLLNQNVRTEKEQQRLYYLARVAVYIIDLPQLNDRTYDQMKGSGNLRLIHDPNISGSITKYYYHAKKIQVGISESLTREQAVIESEGRVFSGLVFQEMTDMETFIFNTPAANPPLITTDKLLINELTMRLHYVVSIMVFGKHFYKQLNEQATKLISDLQKEYHLEK